jgi:hypothetical protein
MQDAALDFLGTSSATLNHLAAIVASDPAKLELVGKKTGPVGDVGSPSADHPWAISDDELNALQTGVTQGLTRWLMPAVVNAGFKVWQAQIPSLGPPYLNPNEATPFTYVCEFNGPFETERRHPFGDVPDPDAWIKLDDGTETYSLVLAGTRYSADDLVEHGHHAPPPSQELLDTLFHTGAGTLGFDRSWFFEQGLAQNLAPDRPFPVRSFYFVSC